MAANIVWLWRSLAIIVVCCLVGWYLIFMLVPMLIFYFRLSKRFLPATRDLRRLDAAARSPIFHHFGEVYNGLTTVRAMQLQDNNFQKNLVKLTTQMEAYYLSNTAARWL